MNPERESTKYKTLKLILTAGAGIGLGLMGNKVLNSFLIGAVEPTKTSVPTDTPTSFPPETATPTPTFEIVNPPTLESTPTKNPYDLGEIYFENNKDLRLTIYAEYYKPTQETPNQKQKNSLEILNTNVNFELLYYKVELTDEEKNTLNDEQKKELILKRLADLTYSARAGEGKALVEVENYKNLVLYLHSGYFGINKKLEAEDFRFFLEGGITYAEKSSNETMAIMKFLEGKVMELQTESGKQQFEIYAVAQIPHSKIEQYNKNTVKILDNVSEINPAFEYFKVNPNGVLISFCGWGPKGYTESNEYTYSRYVIGLKPVN